MNINIIYSILIFNILINNLKSCSIFLSLNCSCYQSNADLNSILSRKIYSHLYCQGNNLNKKTFQSPFGLDFNYQNHFRTISIEFFHENSIEIHSNQFNSLSSLFSQTNQNEKIQISIRFINFTKIILNKQSFTSKMFHNKHQNKHLSLYFISKTMNYIQNESGENNSIDLNNQFKFKENSFSGLILSQLNLFIHTYKDYFSSLYPFEYIFNNTNIGELHFHGSIIPPGPISLRRTFKGLIRSLTLHRHVDVIDSNTYPYYFPVYSYNIHSIEAHSMDLQSFIPEYKNLRGIELIRPRFEVFIDKLIPSLDSLSLDIEYLNEKTILSARHIYNLKLSSRLRRISLEVLNILSKHLKNFDLSQINLSEMTSESRCYLINFIRNNYRKQLNIILPLTEYLTECDCVKIILNDIQFIEKTNDDLSCSKQCRFSDCLTIREYFQEKYPLFINENPSRNIQNQDLPSIDFYSDPNDIDIMIYLINQTNNINSKRTTTTTTTTTIIPLTILDDSNEFIIENSIKLNQSKKTNFFSQLSFKIGVGITLVLIVLISIILFCIIRYKKRQHFIRVPVYV